MNADLIEKMSDVFNDATREASLHWPNSAMKELDMFGVEAVIRAVLEWAEDRQEGYADGYEDAHDLVVRLKREAGL